MRVRYGHEVNRATSSAKSRDVFPNSGSQPPFQHLRISLPEIWTSRVFELFLLHRGRNGRVQVFPKVQVSSSAAPAWAKPYTFPFWVNGLQSFALTFSKGASKIMYDMKFFPLSKFFTVLFYPGRLSKMFLFNLERVCNTSSNSI